MAGSRSNPQAQAGVERCDPGQRRLWNAAAPLRLWHLASLDAPTVAVAWALAFAWAVRVALPAWVPVLLALTTWTVYVADRLLDARAGLRSGATERLRPRHFFHWKHRRILLPLAAAAAGAAIGMAVTLPASAAQQRTTVLAALALVYFGGVHAPGAPRRLVRRAAFPAAALPAADFPAKELMVGVLFAVACALPAFNRTAHASQLALPAAFFAALAALNCLAIEHWESAPGSARGRDGRIAAAGCVVSLAGIALAAAISASAPRPAALLAAGAVSTLLLALLDRFRARIAPVALRAAADLVLLTPLALLMR